MFTGKLNKRLVIVQCVEILLYSVHIKGTLLLYSGWQKEACLKAHPWW